VRSGARARAGSGDDGCRRGARTSPVARGGAGDQVLDDPELLDRAADLRKHRAGNAVDVPGGLAQAGKRDLSWARASSPTYREKGLKRDANETRNTGNLLAAPQVPLLGDVNEAEPLSVTPKTAMFVCRGRSSARAVALSRRRAPSRSPRWRRSRRALALPDACGGSAAGQCHRRSAQPDEPSMSPAGLPRRLECGRSNS
jgi:hypothetical protein